MTHARQWSTRDTRRLRNRTGLPVDAVLLGGLAKALWVIFVIIVPYLGVFIYLIARGHKMTEHAEETAQAQEAAQRAYIQSSVGAAPSTADELGRLADLKQQGAISDNEFDSLKAKALA